MRNEFNLVTMLLEYIIVFLIIFIVNYFLFIRKKTKLNKKKVPIELNYLISIYKINVKKIDYKKFVWIYNITNAFIISTIYIIVIYLLDNLILQIID